MTQENTSETTTATEDGGSDLFNTAAGWVLFAGVVGLGLSIVSDKYFHAYDPEMPEKPGYFIAEPEGADEGPAEMSFAEALTLVSAADGEKVFAKCQACHNVAQGGPNGIGPNLYGVMGAPIGKHAAGFNYSSALSSFGGTWGWEEMNQWLKSPKSYVNGTSMSFAGLSKIEDRAAVALYLNEQGGGLPLPEFTPAADEPGEEVDGPGEGPGVTGGAPVDAVEAAGAMGDEQPVPENPGEPVQ
ncbi:cytochrome c family protein [Erythrobacter sp. THAF29]|uniref:c-type cytochrome n=1 Tax=Erythrobacter sp. THAF29 TaxID=2587851 RepID=UPI0012691B77|nr:cytochrome c family protein [Erythrobacter sp. THAF29]QFT78906.1 Cytochrome c-552 [Erythrobacter sp. THAF29]